MTTNEITTDGRTLDPDKHCVLITTDHGLSATDEDTFYFAYICPGCGNTNPLKGDPREFKEQSFRCLRCTRVSVMFGPSVERFAKEHYDEGDAQRE